MHYSLLNFHPLLSYEIRLIWTPMDLAVLPHTLTISTNTAPAHLYVLFPTRLLVHQRMNANGNSTK
jgi:hypothetical protein